MNLLECGYSCIDGSCPSLLTEERATRLLARVPKNQWRWGEQGGLADELEIPYDQQNAIADKYRRNNDRVSAAVRWLQENWRMSWRTIVRAFDAVEESELADEVRQFLESPAGEIIAERINVRV